MKDRFHISIIIPFYNGAPHIKTCLDSLTKQDFNKPFEIILINDSSTDDGVNIIKMHNIPNLSLHSMAQNSGPGAARNLGLKKAKGEYIFFHDIDDTLDPNILTTLYEPAIKKDCDLVFCDRRYIENSQDQKKNIFSYPADRYFKNSDIVEEMKKRWYDPLRLNGITYFTGMLIRRSIIIDNKIFFEESLRYMEDETFVWCLLGYIKNAIYIRKQLCSFFVHQNTNTALSEGINRGFNHSNFKLMKNYIQKSLIRKGVSELETQKISDQAFIYCIISTLVSYSRSILLGKIDQKKGAKIRKRLIKDIISDLDVKNSIKNYTLSKDESYWIPKSITLGFGFLLEIACINRAKEILKIRRKK
jgi:glycosyltransferase involved in cell wall biosynthesis